MSPIEKDIALAAATAGQSYINNNEAALKAKIAALEDAGLSIVTAGLQNLTKQKLQVGGALSIFAPELQLVEGAVISEVETAAQGLVGKYGPDAAYTFLQHEAALAVAAANAA